MGRDGARVVLEFLFRKDLIRLLYFIAITYSEHKLSVALIELRISHYRQQRIHHIYVPWKN